MNTLYYVTSWECFFSSLRDIAFKQVIIQYSLQNPCGSGGNSSVTILTT